MLKGFFNVPEPKNEPVKNYAPGSEERASLQNALKTARDQEVDIPMYIGSEEVKTGNTTTIHPPHDRAHKIGQFHSGDKEHVTQAINAALGAKQAWENMQLPTYWQVPTETKSMQPPCLANQKMPFRPK